jgi:DNA mismatch repair protein MutS2
MDYDERDLRPLFTFRVGDPGTSHAFDIAARMGFAVDLLDRARRMAGEERVQIEKLLADLDRRARELASAQEEVNLETEKTRTLGRELEERLRGLKKERREILKKSSREVEDMLSQGRRAIEQAVRRIKESGADKPVVQSARRTLERLEKPFTEDPKEIPVPAVIEPGQRVRIPHLGLIGTVLEVRGDRIVATADGLRLTLGKEAVGRLEESGSHEKPSGNIPAGPEQGSWAWHTDVEGAEPEIDLRGESGEDGWLRLDKLIDRAIPAGLEVINVIHGFGTGRLRDHLHARLKDDSRVASFREAGPGQGGGGATLVFLSG